MKTSPPTNFEKHYRRLLAENNYLSKTNAELLEACKRLRKWCMLHEDSRFADKIIAKVEARK